MKLYAVRNAGILDAESFVNKIFTMKFSGKSNKTVAEHAIYFTSKVSPDFAM